MRGYFFDYINELRKTLKQKERGIQKLGQEYVQTFDEDFVFKISVRKNDKKIPLKKN